MSQARHRQASNKQQPTASMREMGKNHNSVVVLRIRLKLSWMIPMGVKNNHKKMSPKLNRGGRERVSQVANTGAKLQFRAKGSLFCPKPPCPKPVQNGQNEAKCWLHSTCNLTSPCQRAPQGPLSTICPRNAPKRAPKSHGGGSWVQSLVSPHIGLCHVASLHLHFNGVVPSQARWEMKSVALLLCLCVKSRRQ